ncbi:SA1362 family protein [Virgibacillus salexigens]|uniref:Uncharacterized protein n=2 Tax=Virgibacillus TaxID=84406 RepID=A0A024QBU9_9BACI|nr:MULTISPECIES: SA1362 family protein [Virgibacillus]GGJ47515.1 hypothetical protein GCM10007111_06910 [Virgibacillus kapii]CDQ39685.1 hypothetical protein BN990_01998 [Virgibacillus massiliensis]
MTRKSISIPVLIILCLAAVGLISQLFTNTANFFSSLFVSIGVGIAIFAVFYFVFIRKRTSPNEMKKYKQAVKQSKAKYHQVQPGKNTTTTPKVQQPSSPKRKRNKKAAHLRVIDGNKHKRKDRASF